MKTATQPQSPSGSRPWYREFHVWLLIALPAAAFFAGLATVIVAMHGADAELPHP
jgi:hypothetical protein